MRQYDMLTVLRRDKNVKIPINAIYFVDDNGKPIKE